MKCHNLIYYVCFFKKEEVPPTDEEMEQEEALKRSFRKVAGDDMEIDAFELRDILNAVFKKGLFNQNYYYILLLFISNFLLQTLIRITDKRQSEFTFNIGSIFVINNFNMK